jgi:hypothetical protein
LRRFSSASITAVLSIQKTQESVLERVVVWPALIVEADIAGLFPDRTRTEPRTGTVRCARVERHAIHRYVDAAEVLHIWCAPERHRTLVWEPAEDCGRIDMFGMLQP